MCKWFNKSIKKDDIEDDDTASAADIQTLLSEVVMANQEIRALREEMKSNRDSRDAAMFSMSRDFHDAMAIQDAKLEILLRVYTGYKPRKGGK